MSAAPPNEANQDTAAPESAPRPSPHLHLRGIESFTFKQYPGQEQVDLQVEIEVPGSWFSEGLSGSLSGGERREKYLAVAVEYDAAHVFKGTSKGRKAAKMAPAIRFVCHDDAADEDDHPGFWMRLEAWNRYRNDTYMNRREDELKYLPKEGQTRAAAAARIAAEKKVEDADGEENKERPPVYDYFKCVKAGTHELKQDDGTMKEVPCEWWECKKKNNGCRVKGGELIKVVKKATGGLLRHLRRCEGEATWLRVRAASIRSKIVKGPDGKLMARMPFQELLPHHIRFVVFCFSNWKHFSMTRAAEFRDYIKGFDIRAGVPARETCVKIIYIIQLLLQQNLVKLLEMMKSSFGSPFVGFLDDIWSKRRCRQSFACARLALGIDGSLLDSFGKGQQPESASKQYAGSIIKCSPVLSFSTLSSSRHSGKTIAAWKEKHLKEVNLDVKDVR